MSMRTQSLPAVDEIALTPSAARLVIPLDHMLEKVFRGEHDGGAPVEVRWAGPHH